MLPPESAQDCVQCIAHIVQWQKLMEENEDISRKFLRIVYKLDKLKNKIKRLKRALANAHELLDRQETLIDTLANT